LSRPPWPAATSPCHPRRRGLAEPGFAGDDPGRGLYGTALVLEEFGNVIARGGAGIVIASQSGHRLGALTAEQDAALATTPTEELLGLPMLAPAQVTDPLHAYQLPSAGIRCG
jgi:hypothetical protein